MDKGFLGSSEHSSLSHCLGGRRLRQVLNAMCPSSSFVWVLETRMMRVTGRRRPLDHDWSQRV